MLPAAVRGGQTQGVRETNDEILVYLKVRDARNHLLGKQLQLSNVAFNYFFLSSSFLAATETFAITAVAAKSNPRTVALH